MIAGIFSLLFAHALGRDDQAGGAIALMLWSASGAMLMAGAANLMTIFLGLELLSLALYCLCGLASRAGARESALKYLILSSTASAFMLYGMALLFGATGSVALSSFAAPPISNALFDLGCGLFLIGLVLQAQSRALSRLDAGRVRGRAAPRHRVYERRHESRHARGARALRVRGAAGRATARRSSCRCGSWPRSR